MRAKFLCVAIVLMAGSVGAVIINVPANQPTIQAGIDAALAGDTVLVWEGTYPERISFQGKNITVAGQYIMDFDTSHISNTIINGNTAQTPMVDDTGSVVRFVSGETAAAELTGLTITNGVGTLGNGGGVLIDGSTPSINHCIVTSNLSDGVFVEHGGPDVTISYSTISYNTGHGIIASIDNYGEGTPLTIENSRVVGNSLDGISGYVCTINYCVIDGNGAGIRVHRGNFRGDTIRNNDLALSMAYMGPLPKPAIFHPTQMDTNMVDCVFEDNAEGFFLMDASASILGSNVTMRNSGSIFLGLDVSCTLTDSRLADGLEVDGGVFTDIDDQRGKLSLIRCVLVNNTATNRGGVFYLRGGYGDEFIDCLFYGNSASVGGVGYSGREVRFENCTFVDNMADTASVFYYDPRVRWDTTTILKSIIAGNSSSPIFIDDTLFGNVTIQCSDFFDNHGPPVNSWNTVDTSDVIYLDTMFCNNVGFEYHIAGLSPCAPNYSPCGELIGAFGIGCAAEPLAMMIPDTQHIFQANALEQETAHVWFGNIVDGHTISDIDIASVSLNGEVSCVFESVDSTLEGFYGEAIGFRYFLSDFLGYYGYPFDTAQYEYSISGQYVGGSPFSINGSIVIVGHLTGDLNLDETVDVADLIAMKDYLFTGGEF